MARENVNPGDTISNIKGGGEKVIGTSDSGAQPQRVDVNPNDIIKDAPVTNKATPFTAVPQSTRAAVNPQTEFESSGMSGEGVQEERKPAVMPDVGQFPTGRKDGKKQGGE